MKSMLRTVLVAVVSTACLMAADLTITYNSTVKGMGRTVEGVQTHYYNANFQKTVDEGTKVDTLADYGKGVFYTINHKEKKIELMTFDDMIAIAEAMDAKMAQMANMPAIVQNMMGGGAKGDVKVEPAGEETVAGRSCKKYKLTLGKMVEELAMDPSLKPPINPAAYAKFMKLKSVMGGPAAAGLKKMTEELSKLQGMALKTQMKGFMGMDSSMVATEVKTSAIAASVFALPADYKTEDVGKKMLKEMQKS